MMNRWLLVIVLAGLVTSVRADSDSTRMKLDEAKAAYEASSEKYRAAVGVWLDKRESSARDKGDKKLVDQVKAERQAFDERGELPPGAPVVLKSRLASARSALDSAYKAAVREHTRAKRDEEAAAVEKEWDLFKAAGVRPADAAKCGEKYFKVFETPLSWHDAKKKCVEMGGRLASIESEEENVFVAELASKARVTAIWLGGSDEKQEGKWLWVDGQAMKYANWDRMSRQPNNAGGAEHCVVLLIEKNRMWWDYPNDPGKYPEFTGKTRPGFVCEWK
jgi:hypothetical protein